MEETVELHYFCALDIKGTGVTTVFVVSKSEWERDRFIADKYLELKKY